MNLRILIRSIELKSVPMKIQSFFFGLSAIAIGCSSPAPKQAGGGVGIPDASKTSKSASEIVEANGNVDAGKKAYVVCATCHGQKAEGMKALNAPALANQESYYLKQQLNNFRNDLRGVHKNDLYGSQMLPMAKILGSDKAVDDVIAYIRSLGPVLTEQTLDGGDPANGKSYYQMVCGACHGPNANGNESLHSPRLAGMEDWYVKRQLENFKKGIRGAEQGDLYGSQMLQIANAIPDEQTMLDLTAYFHSLQSE